MSTEVVVDWHPFEYSTADSFENGKRNFTETVRLEDLPGGGTRVVDLLKAHMPLPRFVRVVVFKFIMIHQHHFDEAIANAARLAAEEFARATNG